MKEIDPKKRLIGTDATLKTSNKVVQFVQESPARSALLGITGFIFFKNLLAPDHPPVKEQREQKDLSQLALPNQQEKEKLIAQSDAASRTFDNSGTVDLRPQALGFESLPDFRAVSDDLPVASGLDAAAFVTKDMLAARSGGTNPFVDRLAMEKASLQAKLADEITVDLSDYAPVTPYEFAGTRPGLNGPEKAPEPQLVSEIIPGLGENLLSLLGLLGGGVSTGSGAGAAAALATTAGVVVDGYIYNAKVYRVDSSGNVVSNVVYTDASGAYTGLNSGTGKIVVEATATSMDMAMGTYFTSALTLYAPASASVVNPITTLIQNIIDNDPTKSLADATSLITTGLGLPTTSGIDFMSFDPIAVYAAGGTNQANALAIQKISSQIAILVTSASASISASSDQLSAASESVIAKIAAAAASYSSSAYYDASTSFLNNSSALQASVQSLGVSSSTIDTVVLYNQKISDVSSLTNVFSTQAVIQAPISAGWVNSSSFSTQFSNLQSSLTSTYGDISRSKTTVTETDSASDISTFGQLGSISGISNPGWTADPGKLSGTYGTFKINPSGSWTFTANSAHNELKTGDVVTQSVQVKSVTGKSTATIAVEILGTNDATVIGEPTISSVTEVSKIVSGNLTATGTIGISNSDTAQTFSTSVTSEEGNLGTLTLSSNGSYTYTVANSDVQHLGDTVLSKVDTFTVTSVDGTTKSVSFIINGANDAAAIGAPTVASVSEDVGAVSGFLSASGTISISDVDSLATFNTSVISALGNLGALTLSSTGSYTYTVANSAVQYLGGSNTKVDTFTVTSADGTTKLVSFTINGVNDAASIGAPTVAFVTEDIGVNGSSNLVASGSISITDVDSSATFNTTVASALGNLGALTLSSNGSYTYTVANSAVQYLGGSDTKVDTFTVTSLDGTAKSVSFTINGVNDAATIDAPTVASVTEDVVLNGSSDLVASGLMSITDVDSSATFNTTVASALGNLGALTLSSTGSGSYTYTYTVANSAVQYLGSGDSKVDTFVLTSADGTTKSVSFTISGANDEALISAPSLASVTKDLGANALGNLIAYGSIGISDVDQNQSFFNASVVSSQGNLGSLALNSNGSYTYNVANSAVHYLLFGDTKQDSFTVTSVDGTTKVLSFTIYGVDNPLENAAVIGAPTVDLLTEDVSVDASGKLVASGFISISDIDEGQSFFDTTVIPVVGNLGSLTLTSTGSYTYTVANSDVQYLRLGDTKVDSFTLTSGDGTSKVVNFYLSGGVNDAAGIDTPTVITVSEDESVVAGYLTAIGTISISDVDQFQSLFNTSVISAAGNLGSLTLSSTGSYTYTVANSAVQYLGDTVLSKVDTFTVTSVDGTTKSVSFTINGVNDAAMIGAPTVATVSEDVGAVSGVLSASGTISISDVDSLTTFNTSNTSVVSATGNLGSLTLSSTGSYTYTVANSAVQYLGGSETKVDTFTVTSADGTAQTVSFTINGVNDAATIGAPTVASVTEDVSVNVSGNLVASGSISISDVDQNQALFNTVVTSTADNLGSLALSSNGSYTYTVANSAAQYLRFGDTKVDSFTVASLDGTSKVVSFNVYGGGNDPAEIGNPTVATVTEDAIVVAGNLTAIGTISISDADQNQSLFNTTVIPAAGNLGALTLSSTGSYTYTVANSAVQYLGGSETKVDTFTVTSADGTAQTVSFTINGVNDAATIGAPTVASVTEDVSLNSSGNLVASGSISISEVDQNQAQFNMVVTSTADNLGSLALSSNGSYTYTVANSAAQYLRFGDTKVDSFTVTSLDGTSKVVSFNVYGGGNDRAVIGDPTVATVTEDASVVADNLTAIGTISISDADQFQSLFNTSVVSATGNLGALTLSSTGSYTYTVANSAVQYLGATQSKVDTFTIASVDGTTKSVSFTINGVNDRPVITATNILTNGQIPLTVKQGSLDASLLTGSAVQATDADTTDQSIPIHYYFADHSASDSKYSYFSIDELTGAISITKLGAQSIAGESFDVPTDYYLNVRATDTYMRSVDDITNLEQQVKIHVDKAVSLDGLSATLPGLSTSWRLMAKTDGTTQLGNGFDAVSVSDSALVISLPKSVQSVSFTDATLNLSNDGSNFGLITDTNTNLQANHTINLAQGTTANVQIDVHSFGNYTIVGASDANSDPDLGTVENFRSDTVGVLNAETSDFAQSSQASFSILQEDLTGVGHEDGYRVGVDLYSATNPQTITGTLQVDDIEYIQFNDKKVTLIGADVQRNEDTIIEVDKAGNYVIVGSSDVVNGVANARKDIVDVVLDSEYPTIPTHTFKTTSDGSVQMVLYEDATKQIIQATSLLRDIESVRFVYKDANNNNVALETVVILAANGYSSVADAQTQYNLSDAQVYLYNPTSTQLNDVYQYI